VDWPEGLAGSGRRLVGSTVGVGWRNGRAGAVGQLVGGPSAASGPLVEYWAEYWLVVISGDWLGSSGRRTGVLVGGDIGRLVSGLVGGLVTFNVGRWRWLSGRRRCGQPVGRLSAATSRTEEYWSEFWSVVMSGTGRSTTGWW
jgi:hypothetical protein